MNFIADKYEERNLKSILNMEKIILYGIGNQCKECYSILKGCNIVLVDGDKKKQGKIWEGGG